MSRNAPSLLKCWSGISGDSASARPPPHLIYGGPRNLNCVKRTRRWSDRLSDLPMKITFVLPPPDLSGGIRAVVAHAQRLMLRGHEVVVVFPKHREPSAWQKAKAWGR